ncbi:MAG: hypothetical protein HGB05_12020 [Chloroflexi bacterium]|nr:hypothetical protein [Chloroflexota bacterium]
MDAITSTATHTPASTVAPRRIAIVFAYLGILIAVPVYGFWRAFIPGDSTPLLLVQSGLLTALFALTFVWKTVRALRGFYLIALAMGLLPALATALVVNTSLGTSLFDNSRYLTSQAGALVWKLIVSLAMCGLLLALGLKRRQFFLVKGDLDAPSKHSRLLPGMKTDETWKRSGRNITIGLFLIATILLLGLNLPRLGLDNLIKALPLLPAALIFAAMNAFHEEFNFRAAPMSQLEPVVGGRHTLLVTVIYFGLGH